jgi:hypothetical protein
MIIKINKKNYTSEFPFLSNYSFSSLYLEEKGIRKGYHGTCVFSPRCLLCCVCLDDFLERFPFLLSGVFCVPFFFFLNGGRMKGREPFSQCTLEGVARHLLFAMAKERGVVV